MPPADGSSIQKSRRIYVRPRTGPQSAHLWWPALAPFLLICSSVTKPIIAIASLRNSLSYEVVVNSCLLEMEREKYNLFTNNRVQWETDG